MNNNFQTLDSLLIGIKNLDKLILTTNNWLDDPTYLVIQMNYNSNQWNNFFEC
jgi:hypothetical protein